MMWYLITFGLGQASMLAICYAVASYDTRHPKVSHAYVPQDQ